MRLEPPLWAVSSSSGLNPKHCSGAPVALPLEWKELKNLQSADQFTMKDVLKRAKSKRAKSLARRQTLPTS
jgi:DNA primase